jgi:beta-carotene 3-hydroxylase
MKELVFAAVLLGSFAAMEWVAWATHKYVMHGPLWILHRDHHQGSHTRLQRNDAFFVIFAIPSWLSIMLGAMNGSTVSVAVGAGIAVYGFAYFLVHEVFIHRRLKFLRDTNSPYWLAVRKAHKMHHKHLDRENGECFGMLWVTRSAIREARATLRKK